MLQKLIKNLDIKAVSTKLASYFPNLLGAFILFIVFYIWTAAYRLTGLSSSPNAIKQSNIVNNTLAIHHRAGSYSQRSLRGIRTSTEAVSFTKTSSTGSRTQHIKKRGRHYVPNRICR